MTFAEILNSIIAEISIPEICVRGRFLTFLISAATQGPGRSGVEFCARIHGRFASYCGRIDAILQNQAFLVDFMMVFQKNFAVFPQTGNSKATFPQYNALTVCIVTINTFRIPKCLRKMHDSRLWLAQELQRIPCLRKVRLDTNTAITPEETNQPTEGLGPEKK